MGYELNGIARYKTLTVTKGNYSQPYNICNEFVYNQGRYEQLSDTDFARLSDEVYEDRLEAFCGWVYSQEVGLQSDCPDLTLGSTADDISACQVGTPVPGSGLG